MNAVNATQEYLAAEVERADPLRRVALLHEHATRCVGRAVRHIERREMAQAHSAFVKAKNIVLHFLASIPDGDDSEVAANLRGLFQYTYQKLVEGNLRKDPQCADAALEVLRSLGEGWAELDTQRRSAAAGQAADDEPPTTGVSLEA